MQEIHCEAQWTHKEEEKSSTVPAGHKQVGLFSLFSEHTRHSVVVFPHVLH